MFLIYTASTIKVILSPFLHFRLFLRTKINNYLPFPSPISSPSNIPIINLFATTNLSLARDASTAVSLF